LGFTQERTMKQIPHVVFLCAICCPHPVECSLVQELDSLTLFMDLISRIFEYRNSLEQQNRTKSTWAMHTLG
jgi:hypothetical protein